MQELSSIYRESFFSRRKSLAWRVPIFCDAVLAVIPTRDIVDAGCANGDLVEGFNKRKVPAIGLEGSPNAVPHMETKHFLIRDLREPLKLPLKFGLCTCLEVAEHIEPEFAEVLISNLTSLSDQTLISAAPPGQKGHHHVNCQPIEYWDDIFHKFGYKRVPKVREELRERLSQWRHKPGIKAYYDNVHFYRNESGESA